MPVRNQLTQKLQSLSTQAIQRAIWVVLAALVVSLILFGGYYYWDRYVHAGDQSPIERDIERMEEVIREEPESIEARVALAEYYLGKGMHEEALDQTNQVLDLYPETEGALLISGITHARMDQPKAAVDPLERFVALRKDQAMAHIDTTLEAAYYFLGESYLRLDRPADAITALEAALVINRTDADALYQLGLAYQASGQPEAALERYHEAVRFVPDFVEAYTGMIESYTALERSDYVAYARGMQALSLQDFGTAQTHLEYATEAQPDFAPAFLGLGLAYEKTGDLDAAQRAIQRVLELNPSDFAAQQALGRIQASMQRQG